MQFQYYKKGQGSIARWVAGICAAILVLYGGICLYRFMPASYTLDDGSTPASFWGMVLIPLDFLDFAVTIRMVIASVVALAGLAGVYLFIINLPRSAEFLICTEDELRKVSWPQRNEYVGSSIAVIISVASLGLFILLADSLLYKLMELLRII